MAHFWDHTSSRGNRSVQKGIQDGEYASLHAVSHANSFEETQEVGHYKDLHKILSPKDRPGEILANQKTSRTLAQKLKSKSACSIHMPRRFFRMRMVSGIFPAWSGQTEKSVLTGLYRKSSSPKNHKQTVRFFVIESLDEIFSGGHTGFDRYMAMYLFPLSIS